MSEFYQKEHSLDDFLDKIENSSEVYSDLSGVYFNITGGGGSGNLPEYENVSGDSSLLTPTFSVESYISRQSGLDWINASEVIKHSLFQRPYKASSGNGIDYFFDPVYTPVTFGFNGFIHGGAPPWGALYATGMGMIQESYGIINDLYDHPKITSYDANPFYCSKPIGYYPNYNPQLARSIDIPFELQAQDSPISRSIDGYTYTNTDVTFHGHTVGHKTEIGTQAFLADADPNNRIFLFYDCPDPSPYYDKALAEDLHWPSSNPLFISWVPQKWRFPRPRYLDGTHVISNPEKNWRWIDSTYHYLPQFLSGLNFLHSDWTGRNEAIIKHYEEDRYPDLETGETGQGLDVKLPPWHEPYFYEFDAYWQNFEVPNNNDGGLLDYFVSNESREGWSYDLDLNQFLFDLDSTESKVVYDYFTDHTGPQEELVYYVVDKYIKSNFSKIDNDYEWLIYQYPSNTTGVNFDERFYLTDKDKFTGIYFSNGILKEGPVGSGGGAYSIFAWKEYAAQEGRKVNPWTNSYGEPTLFKEYSSPSELPGTSISAFTPNGKAIRTDIDALAVTYLNWGKYNGVTYYPVGFWGIGSFENHFIEQSAFDLIGADTDTNYNLTHNWFPATRTYLSGVNATGIPSKYGEDIRISDEDILHFTDRAKVRNFQFLSVAQGRGQDLLNGDPAYEAIGIEYINSGNISSPAVASGYFSDIQAATTSETGFYKNDNKIFKSNDFLDVNDKYIFNTYPQKPPYNFSYLYTNDTIYTIDNTSLAQSVAFKNIPLPETGIAHELNESSFTFPNFFAGKFKEDATGDGSFFSGIEPLDYGKTIKFIYPDGLSEPNLRQFTIKGANVANGYRNADFFNTNVHIGDIKGGYTSAVNLFYHLSRTTTRTGQIDVVNKDADSYDLSTSFLEDGVYYAGVNQFDDTKVSSITGDSNYYQGDQVYYPLLKKSVGDGYSTDPLNITWQAQINHDVGSTGVTGIILHQSTNVDVNKEYGTTNWTDEFLLESDMEDGESISKINQLNAINFKYNHTNFLYETGDGSNLIRSEIATGKYDVVYQNSPLLNSNPFKTYIVWGAGKEGGEFINQRIETLGGSDVSGKVDVSDRYQFNLSATEENKIIDIGSLPRVYGTPNTSPLYAGLENQGYGGLNSFSKDLVAVYSLEFEGFDLRNDKKYVNYNPLVGLEISLNAKAKSKRPSIGGGMNRGYVFGGLPQPAYAGGVETLKHYSNESQIEPVTSLSVLGDPITDDLNWLTASGYLSGYEKIPNGSFGSVRLPYNFQQNFGDHTNTKDLEGGGDAEPNFERNKGILETAGQWGIGNNFDAGDVPSEYQGRPRYP